MRDRDIARLGSLEAATIVAENYTAGVDTVFSGMNEAAVSGWGLYAPEGSKLVAWGSAPIHLEAPPTGPGAEEWISEGILRSVRTMSTARPGETGISGGRHSSGTTGTGGGGIGMRRIILIDWDIRADGNSEWLRLTGVSGLVILTVLMLLLQQRSAGKLTAILREEEKRRQLVQLGMATRTLTHEIRNPLGTIKAQAALLRRTLPEKAGAGLDIIDAESDRLNRLSFKVRDWLADPSGNPATFEADERIQSLLDSGEWPVIVKNETKGLAIRMDPQLFDSTLINLVKNAVESYEETEANKRTEVVVSVVRRDMRIEVKDRGQGIAADELDKIFDPFFTTKVRGSGVGLALARQSVESAGGSLELKARNGGGTVAIVILPLERN